MREKISVLLCGLFILSTAAYTNTVQAQSAATPSVKDWTFLVYLNGNNNLDSFGNLNINQMEQVGSSDKVNIVVQWASESAHDVKRIYVKKDKDTNTVTSPVIQDMGQVDMGDWHNLANFIKWGAANYPAQHYLVDVWDHGSGWHQLQVMQQGSRLMNPAGMVFHPTDISWDDNTGNFMTTKQLGQALAEGAQAIGHKIDIYGSDACLMAMAEIAGEVSNSVSYYVGSQDLEPGAGWPYADILKDWYSSNASSGRDVAKIMVNDYTKSYMNGSNGSQEVTFAAYDLSKMGEFEQSIQALGSQLMKLDAPNRAKVAQAASNTAKFTYDDYGDLGQFLSLVNAANVDGMSRSVMSNVQRAMNDFVIKNSVTNSWQGKANGISFWLPSDMSSYQQYSSQYAQLAFAGSTHWSDALRFFLQDGSGRN